MELWLTVNGKRTCASAPLDPLTRAVVISMFTWRRAEPDDNADVPMGWWGDTWPAVQNDRYGSRLWLLQRSKLTNQLVQTVRGYIRECLQWMIDDGVVSRIDLDIRRTGINELGNSITLWRRDGPVMISFDCDNAWRTVNFSARRWQKISVCSVTIYSPGWTSATRSGAWMKTCGQRCMRRRCIRFTGTSIIWQ